MKKRKHGVDLRFVNKENRTLVITNLLNSVIGELSYLNGTLNEIKSLIYHEETFNNGYKDNPIFAKSIEILELSVRSKNVLCNNDIKTIGDLISKSSDDLLGFDNFGRACLKEVKEGLRKIDLYLSDMRLI